MLSPHRSGSTVRYHGSLTDQHGPYLIDGSCDCADCDERWEIVYANWRYYGGDEPTTTYRLVNYRTGAALECVNHHSVTPVERDQVAAEVWPREYLNHRRAAAPAHS
ncbi:hypothetical protein Lfu02_15070 [Longispora fulva]|uniref:Uncharacterized protein n=1 Tax=Longispora fulva TaxID=619741 RepID=A0A8J7GNV6_9ACTN|nr:hypothetical protein [Longispora fulva]MBG6140483.1 hypothetical protein [Longispora fulva]GIG57135.1 hypothetical protein Lfu02_15070 [Longispora fulva]